MGHLIGIFKEKETKNNTVKTAIEITVNRGTVKMDVKGKWYGMGLSNNLAPHKTGDPNNTQ